MALFCQYISSHSVLENLLSMTKKNKCCTIRDLQLCNWLDFMNSHYPEASHTGSACCTALLEVRSSSICCPRVCSLHFCNFFRSLLLSLSLFFFFFLAEDGLRKEIVGKHIIVLQVFKQQKSSCYLLLNLYVFLFLQVNFHPVSAPACLIC